ncbi:MAG: DNA repair protein RadC [Pseudomonadota bacterium]
MALSDILGALAGRRRSAQPEDELAKRGLFVREHDVGVTISGRTYRHHAALRQAGGQWDAERKLWSFDDPANLLALVAILETPAAAGLAEAPSAPYRPKPVDGHRERLRKRLMTVGADALQDDELLELLLTYATKRADSAGLARELLRSFGSLHAVLAAEPKQLARVDGFAEGGERDREFASVLFRIVRETSARARASSFKERPLIDTPEELSLYLDAALAQSEIEAAHVLFLDAANRLIRDVRMAEGTVDHTPLYRREVAKRAMELNATAVILVHNHPTGDPTPSDADVTMTRMVAEALAAIDVTVYDHVIVGKGRQTSFRESGLL